MTGSRLGHYTILELLGSGGMGDVYRARVERLQRDVAIKVIRKEVIADESYRRRFRQEALALSQLNHPNIQTVHDFDTQDGQDFLVVELLTGTSLRSRISGKPVAEPEILRVGLDLAAALEEAHGKSIVHRDVKPENIRVLPDGRAKLIDFGLAVRHAIDATTVASLTDVHLAVGTPAYLSPERWRGSRADAQSDLYALGVVLYELATGRKPHDKETIEELVHAVTQERPKSPRELNPALSAGLESVVLRLLEPDPQRRYASARELRADLERVQAGRAPHVVPSRFRSAVPALVALGVIAAGVFYLTVVRPKPPRDIGATGEVASIGVLPFENLSRNPDLEYLADGLADELAVQVARNTSLRVVSRASTMLFKGSPKPLSEIGHDLRASVLLTGSVLPSGDSLDFRVQLIEARSARLLWGQSHTATLGSIGSLQRQVAQEIWRVLGLALPTAAEEAPQPPAPVNPKAHDAYLRGRYYFHQYTTDSFRRALDEFERAISIDPMYAMAYAGLADCYWGASEYAMSADIAMPRARAAAQRALDLDPHLANAHAALGTVSLMYDWNWSAANGQFVRSLELNPSDASARQQYGMYLVTQGRSPEADSQLAKARELDPLSPMVGAMSLWPSYFDRRFAVTIREGSRQLAAGTGLPLAHQIVGLARLESGELPRGLAEIEQSTREDSSAFALGFLGYAYARSGRRDEALAIVRRLETRPTVEYVPAYELATIYSALQDSDRAFEWLERAREEHSSFMTLIPFDPRLDGIRRDPRFQVALRKAGRS
ncbi:MAG: protein kinase domain-containing protein [Candidatus Eiseniibacteriota bacterium]